MNIGKKLADLTNPTFSSISVGSILYDVVRDEKGLGIRTLRCVLVNGSEVTVCTLDESNTIRYHETLFNKQFFLSYNKALDAVHEANNVSISITKPQMTALAKKFLKTKESDAGNIQAEIENFIEFIYDSVKK